MRRVPLPLVLALRVRLRVAVDATVRVRCEAVPVRRGLRLRLLKGLGLRIGAARELLETARGMFPNDPSLMLPLARALRGALGDPRALLACAPSAQNGEITPAPALRDTEVELIASTSPVARAPASSSRTSARRR